MPTAREARDAEDGARVDADHRQREGDDRRFGAQGTRGGAGTERLSEEGLALARADDAQAEVVDDGDLPDYRPAVTLGAVRADANNNLWIRQNPSAPIERARRPSTTS